MAFNVLTGSVSTITTIIASGSFTGSFGGDGAQLENVKIFTDEKGMSELELVLKDVSSAARTENIEMVFTENDGDLKYESEIR